MATLSDRKLDAAFGARRGQRFGHCWGVVPDASRRLGWIRAAKAL